MLSEEQLKKIAVSEQTGLFNVTREYAQHLFLKHFYSLEKAGSVMFKGGTALRILFKSPRYSEDLDFSSVGIGIRQIEDLVQDTLAKIDNEGLSCDILESKSISGGYLAILDLNLYGQKISISLEVSFRKKKLKSSLFIVENAYIPAYQCISLFVKDLIEEKIEALVSRKKPRDFFDLYFMLRANLLPERAALKKIMPEIELSNIDFKRELKEYLPVSYQRIIKDFKMILISEIKRYL